MRTDRLERLDAALLALRPVTDVPPGSRTLPHGRGRVELSTVLVVDALARAGGRGCSVGDVAGRLHVAHSTASRLVDRAVGAGMVTRARAGATPGAAAWS